MVSRRLVLALVISGATVILATAVGARIDPGAAAQSGQLLEGTWLLEATASGQAPFPVSGGVSGARFTTYNADGTLVSTSLGRGVIPTTSQGSWIRTGVHVPTLIVFAALESFGREKPIRMFSTSTAGAAP